MGGFRCVKCGEEAEYDYADKLFRCTVCNFKNKTISRPQKCFSCGKPYTEHTWFDPSGCPHCHRSFVD